MAVARTPPTPPNMTTTRVSPALIPGANGGETAVADALGAPLPVDLAQDGSTLFRWNTNVAQAPNPPNTGMLPAQPWALGTYKWTIRATNDWLQVSNDLTLTITLLEAASGLAGDYNADGKVEAADYVVWRKYPGTTAALPNDPHGGTIGALQFNTWRAHFGQTAGTGASANATVPEPVTAIL